MQRYMAVRGDLSQQTVPLSSVGMDSIPLRLWPFAPSR